MANNKKSTSSASKSKKSQSSSSKSKSDTKAKSRAPKGQAEKTKYVGNDKNYTKHSTMKHFKI